MKTAYDDNPEIKETLVAQVQAHYDADEIIHGKYWEDGKGCAVGCIVHSSQHQKFDAIFGEGGESCAYLLDALFELMPNCTAKELPRRFVGAIKPGADLRMVVPQWIYWTLTTDVKPTAYPKCQPFIDAVIALYEEWGRTGVRPADRADRAYRAYRADRAYRAYRAYRADLADLADRAYLADLAALAYRKQRAADKFIELCANAPMGVR